jgi:hypothetical protein
MGLWDDRTMKLSCFWQVAIRVPKIVIYSNPDIIYMIIRGINKIRNYRDFKDYHTDQLNFMLGGKKRHLLTTIKRDILILAKKFFMSHFYYSVRN